MMQIIAVANGILQRIADLCNWLNDGEISEVREEFNKTVSFYLCLEKCLRNTFGADNIHTLRNGCPSKKSIMDFIEWSQKGMRLAHDIKKFVTATKINYLDEGDEEKIRLGYVDIINLVDEVMNIAIVAKEKAY